MYGCHLATSCRQFVRRLDLEERRIHKCDRLPSCCDTVQFNNSLRVNTWLRAPIMQAVRVNSSNPGSTKGELGKLLYTKEFEGLKAGRAAGLFFQNRLETCRGDVAAAGARLGTPASGLCV